MPKKFGSKISLRERLALFFRCQKTSHFGCLWRCVFELSLCLWVVRVPFSIVVIGFLILGVTPQAQDLLIPLVDFHGVSGTFRIVAFFVLHFIFWAALVHYSARLLINDDLRLYKYRQKYPSRYFKGLELWVPRLLGASTFLALIISANRARINLPVINDVGVTASITCSLYSFMILCVLAMILFLYYMIYRIKLAKMMRIGRVSNTAKKLHPLFNLLDVGKNNSAEQLRRDVTDEDYFGRSLLFSVFIVFAFVLLTAPSQIAEWFPRAFAVSLLLGGWLPALTYLSAIGRRLRAPLIVATFGGIAVLTAIVGDNHDVRLIDNTTSDAPNIDKPKLRLDHAVNMWMEANGCKEKNKERGTPQNCPRPIIIAAAGGASRAGFFTASVIGELLDKASDHNLDADKVRDRLFAISSVSGSSVAAVMTVTALAAARKDTKAPCLAPSAKEAAPFSLWYGDKIENWRGCLESLMSGDSLTPTFIGLGFHDVIPFGPWVDRAVMIERSWERVFADAIKKGVGRGVRLHCPADLECPFRSLQPDSDFWLPLLILNGVSVGSGDRVVTTLLDRTYHATGKCRSGDEANNCPLFSETWFFHDLLRQPTQSTNWRAKIQRVLKSYSLAGKVPNDIRLSTAAHNSARFPAVSPPGSIRNQEHNVVDRIVDGGYLENYGVLTALELAQGIRAVEPKLIPFVLVVSNDPNDPNNPPVLQDLPDNVKKTDYLTDVTSFLAAVSHTRDARATLAVEQLHDAFFASTPIDCKVSFAHIRVWPEFVDPKKKSCAKENLTQKPRVISLSWWLSTPLQYRLFEQIEGNETCNKNDLGYVWQALTMGSECANAQ